MRQFFTASPGEFSELQRKAAGRCITFEQQELPPGCDPPEARVGIEGDLASGKVVLYVQKGISYRGSDASVQSWLAQGRQEFSSFEQLRQWIQHVLAAADEPIATGTPSALSAWLSRDWGQREDFLPLVGRAAEIEEAELALERQIAKTAVLFVGRSGVGKTAICRELAWRWQELSSNNVALRVDLPALLAGTVYPAERGPRLQQVYDQVTRLGSSTLVILEDLHLACGSPANRSKAYTSGTESSNPSLQDRWTAAMIAHWIDAGLRIIATTTPDGLRSLRGPALRRRIHVLEVSEPTQEELIETILPAVAMHISQSYGVEVVPQALPLLARRSDELSGAQPDKAIRLLDSLTTRACQRGFHLVGPDDLVWQSG